MIDCTKNLLISETYIMEVDISSLNVNNSVIQIMKWDKSQKKGALVRTFRGMAAARIYYNLLIKGERLR